MSEKLQCPCGRIIDSPKGYKALYLRGLREIAIICPNDNCHVRELGYVSFEVEGREVRFKTAAFYRPYVSWNVNQLGNEKAVEVLKAHLHELVAKIIDWQKIARKV
jgi:hypothetical protein